MTRRTEPRNKKVVIATSLAMGLGAYVALAGSASTTLPNGASLEVSIDDPVTSTEFKVPHDQDTIDVDVTGMASVGLGDPDATFVYVIDVSGSTNSGGGTGCSPIRVCEQQFFVALNAAVDADGSSDEVGVVVYGANAAIADMSAAGGQQDFTLPSSPGVATVVNSTGNGTVGQFTPLNVGSGSTNCTAALNRARTLVNASSNGSNNVVFASDGLCNTGGNITSEVNMLQATGAVVNSVAIGSGSNCTSNGGTGTLNQIAVNGGQCFPVPNPGNLPDIIPNLIGSTLVALKIEVDGGGPQTIPNSDITPDLPQAGSAMVDYTTTVPGLGPGDHEICVTAQGSDVSEETADVTRCETIHLLKLTAAPETDTNEVGSMHTVTATILGDPGQVAGRAVDFAVSGANAGAMGSCSPNADCTTDASGAVSFSYTGANPGHDTITVTTSIAGMDDSIELEKFWEDLTASPAFETNELGSDNMHTVTATIVGDPSTVGGRAVGFVVSGQNAGATGTCSANADCTTDAAGNVSFSYSVPVAPSSLGTDTITVSSLIAGSLDSVELQKEWVDTTPPVAECQESVNPHGQNKPRAHRQNEDGFYLLSASDDVWAAGDLEIFVDVGGGATIGPFSVGDTIKYTQAPGSGPKSKKMGSSNGQAGAVTAHLIGSGDAVVTAVDGSGNVSAPVSCLVPPPPK